MPDIPSFTQDAMDRIKQTVRTVEGWGDRSGPRGERSVLPAVFHGWLVRATEFATAGDVIDFDLMAPGGSKGNEEPSGQLIPVFVREGLVFEGGIYRAANFCGGSDAAFEIINPVLRFRGVTVAPIDQDQTGDVAVYRRTSAEGYEDTGEVLECLNDVDVDFGASAVVEVAFDDLDEDGKALWRISNGDFTCPSEE